MGRIAGVTAEQTRERLLLAAADVFGQRGYDGTRVADIAAAAGVSNGALYAHFGSKAELLEAALRTHGRRLLADLIRVAQAAGEIDQGLSPDALAHLCLLLGTGSALVTAEMHSVNSTDWSELLGRIVAGLGPAQTGASSR